MQNNSPNPIIREAFLRHAKTVEESLAQLLPEIQKSAEMLLGVVNAGRKILACGNGGSAADAQHLAAEWVCRYKDDRPPLAAVALTVDTSALTAIGNDYGFENVFARQVEALGNSGDILVVFTTSGKSKNILNAIQAAKKKGLKIIALTGGKGKDLKNVVDAAIIVPTEETARIQEIHELIYHIWCEFVDEKS
ncbi:MAG: D-sedoheptulose 7-phosphate isomerase [Candidatus Liptonbacteria bacterium]|nr:D-sedoheptulose 7-phosphate isomerase [Candidatus Liptonbacteria bacterium]